MDISNRHLMWHGMLLFLLGLATGLVEQQFTNVRMGLSAHLEGLFNGIFLIALGAIWSEVRLPSWAKVTAYWPRFTPPTGTGWSRRSPRFSVPQPTRRSPQQVM
jgi:hypothetical protein